MNQTIFRPARRGKAPWTFVLPGARLLLILLSPLIAILACQWIALQSFPAAWGWLFGRPAAVGYWYLLLLLPQLILTGLTRLSGAAALLSALPHLGLTLASYYKAVINGEPLMLSDLSMAGQLGEVAGFAGDKLAPSAATAGAVALMLAAAAVLTALDVLSLLGWDGARLSLPAGFALGGFGALYLVLALRGPLPGYGAAQYGQYPMQADRDLACGVPLSLLSTWYGGQPDGSDSYGEVRMASLLWEMERAQAAQPPSGVRPHIIFVMNESFFDLTRLPDLTFSQDPLPNYHRLQGLPEVTYGPFFTNTCGGGTGWVEMDTFTGVSNPELNAATANTDLDSALYTAMPSYVRVLGDNGYRTVAFHAHTDELFNRARNFPLLGFDEVIFREPYMDQATFFGGFFDDASATRVLLSLFEQYHRDSPLFLYVMTMQNHQPYNSGRYGGEEKLQVDSGRLSPVELEMVSCYATGVYDADQMLGRLVDYFSQVDEPVMLVFAGDHRPGFALGDGESVYTTLGLVPTATSVGWEAEHYLEMLNTNYLIWTNYAPGQGEQINGTYVMGASILELAGVNSTPFFSWLAQNRRETVGFHHRLLTLDPEGQMISEEEPEAAAFLSSYHDAIYDFLYGEQYIAQRANAVSGGSG